MSISAIASGSTNYLAALQSSARVSSSGSSSDSNPMDDLSQALESGDLEAAKSAFSKLKDQMEKGGGPGGPGGPGGMPPPPPPTSASSSSDDDSDEDDSSISSLSSTSSSSTSSSSSDPASLFNQLQAALESDDLETAQSVFATLQANAPKPPSGTGSSTGVSSTGPIGNLGNNVDVSV
ncbi:hypothetical protein [Plasticicumulans acidivorans]|uniref:Uncharacterized protein n=1 Tax=Plasticicumulans acidivorans TaxID=886464 RepID=A0A317MVS2_9GAMM|nr:hypothetical protein [Plasticicumulans acidivorans]PWV62405.1 hypothetical protein C7443_104200 [Plasticicumulans acidivorans]